MNAPSDLQQQTRRILEKVGWHAGRTVSTTRWESELAADGFPPLHAVALQFLSEFGGLLLPGGGAGVTRAREPITLVPTECSGEADRFIEWGMHIGRDIAPIGELASGTCACSFLGIDEQAEIYVVVDVLATFGQMPQALDHLVLGYMPRDIT
ncbi:SUKH-3 domain-containing protein [Micromonospora sp. RHAY321]|uniref:SUKH-3 domain-containing protein n=1 Tax=Micromonospora sp. RHAY321 TaxID=2944807 RepID=UPI00207D12F4|nr:SUKH-3 domain-containing protein [Micromonospora sp. RHAY321]MCO1595547.1 SUKH-3 domain-containing protein [Micromonospora sp. RHAY321]